VNELPLIELADRAAWRAWLTEHHAGSAGAWLKLAKKGAPQQTVAQQEAVEEALCFGWIDGQVGRLDEHFYRMRVTPRRPRSRWSLLNTQKVQALIEQGLMHPAGLAQIQAAQADGRWEAAYNQAQETVPDDLQAALVANPTAAEFFATLSSQNRFAFLFRLGDAKRPETRKRRIEQYVQMLLERRTFH
jgi:uncharacterized protein YdeI (YjbR/CyaY-like superfamily)